jgi:hypothetical protein
LWEHIPQKNNIGWIHLDVGRDGHVLAVDKLKRRIFWRSGVKLANTGNAVEDAKLRKGEGWAEIKMMDPSHKAAEVAICTTGHFYFTTGSELFWRDMVTDKTEKGNKGTNWVKDTSVADAASKKFSSITCGKDGQMAYID